MAIAASILGGLIGFMAFIIGLIGFDLSFGAAMALYFQAGLSTFVFFVVARLAQHRIALATTQMRRPDDIPSYR